MSSTGTAPTEARSETTKSLTLETLVIAALGVFGLRVGLRPISDNSSFVHIRTGIEVTRTWHIPRTDPYSFTAHGHPWVVQSWLASVVYGAAYRVGGLVSNSFRLHALLLLQGLLMGALAILISLLARTGSARRTMATAPAAVLFGAVYWSPRPLIFGLLGLALLILVVMRRANPLWLLPIIWVWVNTHGSFPLGVAWLGAYVVGTMLDTKSLARELWPYVGALVGGLALGAVNPLGPVLLTFPITVEKKASVFKNVVEWRSPNFQSVDGIFTLALLSVVLLIILRARLPWAFVLPAVGFLAGGLLSLRNIAPAAVVFAPVLADAMRPPVPPGDEPDPSDQSTDPAVARLNRMVAGLLAGLSALFALVSLRGSALDLSTYPTDAVTWMTTRGYLDPALHRVAEQDVNGCYLILLRGSSGRDFIDDRVDMYPVSVSDDYDALLHADPSSPTILAKYQVDTVLWDRHLALPTLLLQNGGWKRAYQDKHWDVLVHS